MYVFTANHLVLGNQLGKTVSPRSAFLACLDSFVWGWGLVSSRPHVVNMSVDIILVQGVLSSHAGKAWQVLLLAFLGDKVSLTANSLFLSILRSSDPLFWSVPWAWDSGVAQQMYPLGLGSTSVHFDWLWFTVMVFICWKRRSLDEGERRHFSVGIRTNV